MPKDKTNNQTTSTTNRFIKALALSIGLSSSGINEAYSSTPTEDKTITPTEMSYSPQKDNKYTTTIKVRNDSIEFNTGTNAYYTPENNGEIRLIKADISANDFGFKSNSPHEELLLIHERQHQIDFEIKGIGKLPLSLEEDFQKTFHLEVGARIAELLEVRRQYKEAQTPTEKENILQKFENDETTKNYIKAIKEGSINPNSTSSKDFNQEMTFIKNEAISYMIDPNDSSYDKSLINHAIINLNNNKDYSQSHPNNLLTEIEKIYHIGGFDFNSVGTNTLKLRNNPTTEIANNLLLNGASKDNIIDFLEKGKGVFSNHSALKKGDALDLTGLSKEQAMEVLKTCYVAQLQKDRIYEELILGEQYNHQENFTIPNQYYEEELAIYLNAKQEVLQKNNTLTEHGDEAKFNQLMSIAKTIELDPKSWFEEVKGILNITKDPSKQQELEEALKKIETTQGKTISTDEFSSGITTPSQENLDKALQKYFTEKEENRKFNEEYSKNHPPSAKRLSDFYQKEIMDLQSSILQDELEQRKKEENKVEELRPSQNLETYTPIGDGKMIQIKTPEFKQAELKKITSSTGESIEVAVIDGKKHGAEITRNSKGEITNYKLYDHGKELDPTQHEVNLKTQTQDGMTYTSLELDGKQFGAEIITDANGKTKASFYNQNGIQIKGSNITKNYVDGNFNSHQQHLAESTPKNTSRILLKEELKQQKGSLPTSIKHAKQTKQINKHLETRPKTMTKQKTTLPPKTQLSTLQLQNLNHQR